MSRRPPALLGLDLGSSSARAFVYDANGTPLAGHRTGYVWTATQDGGLEIDAESLVGFAVAAVDGLLADVRGRGIEIAAVGISTFWHGLVGIDAELRPVTPAYSWGDTRATAAAAALRQRVDGAALHARTGAFLHPSFPSVKLVWLRDAAPDAFAAARWWISPGELVAARLCGILRHSMSMASASGLFDQNALDWDDEMLALGGVSREQLLPVVPEPILARGLAPEFRSRWPELDGIPWLAPAGDGACANVGSGCWDAASAALSVGTTAAVRVVSAAPRVAIPRDLFCYRLDARRFVLGGATSNGGNVWQWAREVLRLGREEEIEAAIDAIDPASHGLVVEPFLAGERSPDWPLGARAAIAGISLATTPVEILRAFMEGVARRIASVRAHVREYAPDSAIVASGRALAASPPFARIICDMLGERLLLSDFGETSSRGAALLAGEAIGALEIERVPRLEGRIFEPDMRRNEFYRSVIPSV
ncbi:MAG: gluconokinase [Thermoanaerobaculia bacterium]